MNQLPPQENKTITFEIDEQKVMFDVDVAEYFATTVEEIHKLINENINRFPDDFILQFTPREYERFLKAFPEKRFLELKTMPLGITEGGLAMLSSLLNTGEAIDHNVSVIRLFVKMARVSTNTELMEQRIATLEGHVQEQFEQMMDALQQFNSRVMSNGGDSRTPIGYKK